MHYSMEVPPHKIKMFFAFCMEKYRKIINIAENLSYTVFSVIFLDNSTMLNSTC